MVTQYKDDIFYLKFAYDNAVNSPDPSTQNGVLILADHEPWTYGCNRLPEGMSATPEQWADRDWKYPRVVHAEVDGVCNAARLGREIGYGTMYCTWAACSNCAKTIIQAGIRRVVSHKHPLQGQHCNWKDDITFAKILFEESGVEFVEIEEYLGKTIRFNREVVTV